MSDLNDDLLNYELGDDLDDHALYGADEDELLLSDDDLEKDVSQEEKRQLKEEAEEWVSEQTSDKTNCHDNPSKLPEEVSSSGNAKAANTQDESSTKPNAPTASDSDVSTSEESPIKQQPAPVCDFKQPIQQAIAIATTTSSCEEVVTSSNYEEHAQVEYSNVSSLNVHAPEFMLPSSQDSSSVAGTEFSDPREDPEEEREERTNIKQATEREMEDGVDSSPDKHQNRFIHSKRGRGGIGGALMRGGMMYPGQRPLLRFPPHGGLMGPGGAGGGFPQYPHHPNENLNPQLIPGQYPGQNPYIPDQKPLRHTYPLNQHTVPGPRMDFRQPTGSYRLPNPNMYGQVPHNEYSGGAVPSNGLPYVGSFPPNHHQRQMFRPELSSAMPGIRPPRVPLHRPPNMMMQGNPNFVNPAASQQGNLQRQQIPPQSQLPPVSAAAPIATSQQPIRPSKVLINPNFKGGVEAATSKFIQETQFMHTISSHVSHLQSDQELLRQQEEFINKNMQHIEKRRNERSPPPRQRSRSRDRSRSRERSYSPPKRDRHMDRGSNNVGGTGGPGNQDRDRDRRAGSRDRYNSFNRGRFRRANSREYENRNYGKRRRSASPMRRRDRDRSDMEEDEETRVYRLEIEKQKALREKILKDKEMRRRRAAEEKHHEDKPQNDEAPQKLKPIIVTESKIISLKRKQADIDALKKHESYSHGNGSSSSSSRNSSKSIPTAKILPEAKRTLSEHLSASHGNNGGGGSSSSHSTATAIIKPVMKKPPTPSSQQIAAKPAKLHDTPSEDELDYDDIDLLNDEDRLLADTPSPPPSPGPPSPKPSVNKNSKAFSSSHRRVVLKSSPSSSSSERRTDESRGRGGGGRDRPRNKESNDENYRKGIFDRLDRKIGVSEPNKRRIQRIVMKNSSED